MVVYGGLVWIRSPGSGWSSSDDRRRRASRGLDFGMAPTTNRSFSFSLPGPGFGWYTSLSDQPETIMFMSSDHHYVRQLFGQAQLNSYATLCLSWPRRGMQSHDEHLEEEKNQNWNVSLAV